MTCPGISNVREVHVYPRRLLRARTGKKMPRSGLPFTTVHGSIVDGFPSTTVHGSIIHGCQEVEANQVAWMDEGISKMWSVHTMEYYSVFQRKEIQTSAIAGMNLENMVLSETSQSQPGRIWLHLCEVPRGVEFIEMRWGVSRGRWGGGTGGLVFHGDRVPIWEDEKCLETDGGDSCAAVVNVHRATDLDN